MKMGLPELAHFTYQGLKSRGIIVTLSGGACVSLYTDNAYQSRDLDFIRQIHVSITVVAEAMSEMGFQREGRHFSHPDSDYYVEFPPPPLTVGNEAPGDAEERIIKASPRKLSLRMLSPTDCVKDRLCQFFYWNDRQSLDQAMLVAAKKKVDLLEIERWAGREKMSVKCSEFLSLLAKKHRTSEGPPKMGKKPRNF